MPSPRRPPTAVVAMACGAALMSAALLVPVLAVDDNAGKGAGTAASTTADFPDVGTAPNVYEPGHTSGWHVHPGVHSAVVLTGTLSIYESDCSRHDYGPGDSYLGGREPHVARNDTAEPVQLVVTYVFQRGPALDHATVLAPPAGCDVR